MTPDTLQFFTINKKLALNPGGDFGR